MNLTDVNLSKGQSNVCIFSYHAQILVATASPWPVNPHASVNIMDAVKLLIRAYAGILEAHALKAATRNAIILH